MEDPDEDVMTVVSPIPTDPAKGLTPGGIAGIVIGVLSAVGVATAATGVYVYRKRTNDVELQMLDSLLLSNVIMGQGIGDCHASCHVSV
jgi:hypothetical protein